MNKEYFECKCFNTDCLLVVHTDKGDMDKVWVSMAVKRGGFFYRVRQAFKFVFTRHDWAFHDMILHDKDLERLRNTIDEVID